MLNTSSLMLPSRITAKVHMFSGLETLVLLISLSLFVTLSVSLSVCSLSLSSLLSPILSN